MLKSIGEEDRRQIELVERSSVMEGTGNPDPVFWAAAGLWFRDATLLQCPRVRSRTGRSEERLRQNLAAYADGFGVSKAVSYFLEDTSVQGGYTVPAPVGAEILRLINDNSVIRPLARKFPMTSKTLDLANETTAPTVYIVPEAGDLTQGFDQTTFGQTRLTAKKFVGRAAASIELVEDNIVGLLDYVQARFAEEIGAKEDTEALEGDGTNFTGVILESGVNSYATTTTDGEAIIYQDLVKTIFTARQRSARRGARWFMSPEQFAAIVAMRSDATTAGDAAGQPVVQFGNVPNGIQPFILGYPVEVMSTISISRTRGSTGNTSNVYFGPPRAILFGERGGFRWDVSDAPSWSTYMLDMRLVKRTAITVGVPSAWTKLVGGTYS